MFDDKNLELVINYGAYKPKYFLRRVIITSVAAVALLHIARFISGEIIPEEVKRIYAYGIIVVAFNSILEINLLVVRLLSRSNRWRWNIYLQAFIIIIVSAILTFFWVNVAQHLLLDAEKILNHQITQITLLVGLLIIFIHLLVIVISNLTQEWMNNRKEISELKQAKLLSDYNSLKDRLNPHFLFNNLSVLKSLIHYDPKGAEVFTQNFTNVYRYVLNSHEEKTVAVEKELKFLESYIALHQERIGNSLVVNINITEEATQRRIPPMSIQLLVENAIKHNIANKTNPLQIDIYSEKESITVKNNLNKKDTTYSTHTGLDTLNAQYRLLANKEVSVIEDDLFYFASIPLL